MMATSQRIVDWYQWMISDGDPKTADWPLIATPWPTISLVAVYLFIVKQGPKLMENRKPFDLKWVLVIYNFALVFLSGYIVYEFIASILDIPNFNWVCEPVYYTQDNPKLTRLARVCYIYYLSKFVEYLDTFFFILRKKNNQVTFLHVYHHASMCCIWWLVCKWIPGGTSYFGAACNSLIHVLMYTYYGLSSMGPAVRPYLWWKRYLTRLQLIQFAANITVGIINLTRKCAYPAWGMWIQVLYCLSLMALFVEFYMKTYLQKKGEKKQH